MAKVEGLAAAVRRVLELADSSALLQRLVASASIRSLSNLDAATHAALVAQVASTVVREHSPPSHLLVWLNHNAQETVKVLHHNAHLKHELQEALNVLSSENSDRGIHAALLHFKLEGDPLGTSSFY